MATLMVERPQMEELEDELAVLKRESDELARLPFPLFGKLPEGYLFQEDPLDPAGTAD